MVETNKCEEKKSFRKTKKVAEHINLSWYNQKFVKEFQQSLKRQHNISGEKLKISWKGSGVYELKLLWQKMCKKFKENQKGSGTC